MWTRTRIKRGLVDYMLCNVYRATKSHEILMFVRLQKDAKQCCAITTLDCAHFSGRAKTGSAFVTSPGRSAFYDVPCCGCSSSFCFVFFTVVKRFPCDLPSPIVFLCFSHNAHNRPGIGLHNNTMCLVRFSICLLFNLIDSAVLLRKINLPFVQVAYEPCTI